MFMYLQIFFIGLYIYIYKGSSEGRESFSVPLSVFNIIIGINLHGALDVLRIIYRMPTPRTPFPSFTLVLSRQAAGDNEGGIGAQEMNASKPSMDLMVSQ